MSFLFFWLARATGEDFTLSVDVNMSRLTAGGSIIVRMYVSHEVQAFFGVMQPKKLWPGLVDQTWYALGGGHDKRQPACNQQGARAVGVHATPWTMGTFTVHI